MAICYQPERRPLYRVSQDWLLAFLFLSSLTFMIIGPESIIIWLSGHWIQEVKTQPAGCAGLAKDLCLVHLLGHQAAAHKMRHQVNVTMRVCFVMTFGCACLSRVAAFETPKQAFGCSRFVLEKSSTRPGLIAPLLVHFSRYPSGFLDAPSHCTFEPDMLSGQ